MSMLTRPSYPPLRLAGAGHFARLICRRYRRPLLLALCVVFCAGWLVAFYFMVSEIARILGALYAGQQGGYSVVTSQAPASGVVWWS